MIQSIPFEHLLIKVIDNRGKTCPTSDHGLPLIATNCVKNSTLYPTFEKIRYVDDETYRHWFRGHPQPGDIIFVTKGAPGQLCLTPDPVDFCIAQDMVAARADPSLIYPPYLFAALRSQTVQNDIANMHVGTMIPHFKKGDFDKLKIPVPSTEIQKFTGDMYLRVSEKIDLNRRMNETLETMARTIFKDWFVDFGPTRAKIVGRSPYLSPDVWALFPDRLDDDGKPEGWSSKRIEDILDLAYGKAMPASSRIAGEYPVYGSGGITGYHAEALVPGPSVIVGRKGTVGSLYWEDRSCFPIDTVFYVVPKHTPLTFCFYLLNSLGLESMNTDAAVPGLNRGNVYRLTGPWAVPDLIERFDAVARPLRKRMNATNEEIRTLANIRDLLLPRLMSGEIRIRDAEKMVEMVL